MTTRARAMLDALEAHGGAATRSEIWDHAGRFYLTNNASAELRAAGVDVVYERDTDTYRLLDEGRGTTDGYEHLPLSAPVAALVEEVSGQFSMEVAA